MVGFLDARVESVVHEVKDGEGGAEVATLRGSAEMTAVVARESLLSVLCLLLVDLSENLVKHLHLTVHLVNELIMLLSLGLPHVLLGILVLMALHLLVVTMHLGHDVGVDAEFPGAEEGCDQEHDQAFFEGAADPTSVLLELADTVADASCEKNEGPHEER